MALRTSSRIKNTKKIAPHLFYNPGDAPASTGCSLPLMLQKQIKIKVENSDSLNAKLGNLSCLNNCASTEREGETEIFSFVDSVFL